MKPPVYHRQRFLLLLLDAAGGPLGRMDLQKLVFLHGQEAKDPHYAFTPYHYGAYSFQCADDLDLLNKRGWLTLDERDVSLLHPLPRQVTPSGAVVALKAWLSNHRERGDSLVRKTYLAHPFFAKHSKMKGRVLSATELASVDRANRATTAGPSLVKTIGYEGIAFETYLNRLICSGTTALCDVRNNPRSRKFGFSAESLGRILPKLGIGYHHLPELGITSSKRRKLETREDYEELFTEYRETLPEREAPLGQLCEIIGNNSGTALTCFEADPAFCHRSSLSDWLASEKAFSVEHLQG